MDRTYRTYMTYMGHREQSSIGEARRCSRFFTFHFLPFTVQLSSSRMRSRAAEMRDSALSFVRQSLGMASIPR
jgi:hypothetical protein